MRDHRALLPLLVCGVLAGCAGPGFSGSGEGFGGFGARTTPAATVGQGYTQRRLTGMADDVQPLQPDTSIGWPRLTLERLSVFETEQERRERERRGREARGSSTPPRPEIRQRTDPADLVDRAPERELDPPPLDNRGRPIPGAPPGTVTTGGSGRIGTFGGPAGSGTILRDGATMTLMGADGQVRTVPAPR